MKFIAILFILFSTSNAYSYDALVVSVHDGDTITVLINNTKQSIRIQKMDSPEIAYNYMGNKVPYQPYANESRDSLAKLCLNKIATISTKGISGSRLVGNVSCDGKDVANYQIENGMGWVYHYGSTKKTKSVMELAKSNKLGLWSQPNPIDPYFWRKGIYK